MMAVTRHTSHVTRHTSQSMIQALSFHHGLATAAAGAAAGGADNSMFATQQQVRCEV
jgi:hypothetical protein